MSQALEFKLNIGDKKGKAYIKIVKEEQANALIGYKIGQTVQGNIIGLEDWTFTITGGSDRSGFPMRKSVDGPGRKKHLLSGGVGYHPPRKGRRARKSVRGNTISEAIYQINLKVEKEGKRPLEELIGEASS
ncbi:MAG: 30S ribosomal protein S6e [Candidatus Heimdallarchaeaceae archaeon]|uniref:Small ribosomal subunit protein eS6 n=1 Tax=Candidatus Heimdallarchaeum endolithica TaxID=2876572 RepID=A0A9Y1FMY5_9ARCH|nr:MAG: 30S ribosomal protein S6e [Candidatus Heimdallarchaeum endolithica]